MARAERSGKQQPWEIAFFFARASLTSEKVNVKVASPDIHWPGTQPMAVIHPETALLRDLPDQAFERKAWHGPNLRGSIRGLTAVQATWRAAPGGHCIAEIVVHAAYWKYAVRRKLRGDERGSFPLKGSNWFPLLEAFTEAVRRSHVKLLTDEHRTLRATVAAFDPRQLWRASSSKYTAAALIQGIAAHDIYHAGQIQLLKRLQRT
jgi:hypothetical protein